MSFETRLYSLLFCSTLLHSLIAHALGLRFLSFLISWIRHDTDHFISASFNSRLNTFKDQRQNFFLKTHKRSQLHYNLPPPPKKKTKKKDLTRQKSEYDSFFPNYRLHQNKCWLETVLKFLIHLVISLCVYGSDLYIPGIQLIVHVFHDSCLLKLLGFFFFTILKHSFMNNSL